jgi:hypothetical protein
LRVPFGGHPARARFVKIADGDEVTDVLRRERGMQTRVLSPEMSNSDDCGS